MNKVLAEYISICSQFRKDGLSKPERKQRHAMLSEWTKNIHTDESRQCWNYVNFGIVMANCAIIIISSNP